MKSLLIALVPTSTPPSTDPGHIEPGYILGSLKKNPPPMPGAIKAMGAQWEMDYRTLRSALLKTGWNALPREYSHSTVLGFPEVNCGQGWQAVCSSGFRKGERELFLWLHPTGSKLILIGAE